MACCGDSNGDSPAMFTSLERNKQEQERGKVPLVRVEDAEGPFLVRGLNR